MNYCYRCKFWDRKHIYWRKGVTEDQKDIWGKDMNSFDNDLIEAECRHRAPILENGKKLWPTTFGSDFCGEYEWASADDVGISVDPTEK